MRRVLASIITVYQHTLSPDHGWSRNAHPYGYCRFYPTCSEYAKQSILRYGSGRGLWLGFRRILRCHPWSRGGVDMIPTH